MSNVLLLDGIDPSCIDIFERNKISVDIKIKINSDELIKIIKDYDALLVRSATKVTREVIEAGGKRLKVIGRAGSGVDNIDVKFASEKNIYVMNTPDANSQSAVEHTCGLILSLARHIPQAYSSLLQKKWNRSLFVGSEVNGKVLGCIGSGRIGLEVALKMSAFGMEALLYDPYVEESSKASTKNVKFVSLEEIWQFSDYITLHVPLTKETKGMIGADVLSRCKKGVKVLNVARGGLIDEEALCQALHSGQVSGAAIDVFEKEPPDFEKSSLFSAPHPACIFTPHLGASTREAQKRASTHIAEQMVAFFQNGDKKES